MANDNDKKIKELLAAVEKKRKELGTKPRLHLKTNGLIEGTNINTINTLDKCVVLAAKLMQEQSFTQEACRVLGVPEQNTERVTMLRNCLDDLKLRTEVIQWEAEKKKLQAMERKLKDLRSEDAKTQDALADIASML
jgi:hypothetical protein